MSRRHLEITLDDQGRFFCVDRCSSHGTFVWRNQAWEKLKQGYVMAEETISLGKKKMLFADIVRPAMLEKNKLEAHMDKVFEPISVKPHRNPLTGEVEGD